MLNSAIYIYWESHKNREVLYVKSIENVQIPLLEILGLCFMYLWKREGHMSLRLNFMFPHINLYMPPNG